MDDTPKTGTRRLLLAAAARVIRQQGVRQLTLEAAAAEAGVSKGGLLYHFPGKEALIKGLLDQACADFDQAIAARLDQGMDWLAAYSDAALTPGELDDLGPALLGAMAENRALLEHAREYFRSWYGEARRRTGTGGVLALLVLDGLFIHQVFGFGPVLSPEELAGALHTLAAIPSPPEDA
jgi:AcrR family transcriptional regulator